ncbi:hypothetical protein NYZ39_18040, partial [Acinetobacter baumannii]|nr:hypothetical protein [Acinetobacter baumannii]
PIGCTVDFRCRLIHLKIILWNKPLEIGLCNKANFRRVLRGPAFLKLRKLIYYVTQDIKLIILEDKRR